MASPAWDPADDKRLRELARAGMPLAEISRELHRSSSAVRNRAKRLRLELYKRRHPVPVKEPQGPPSKKSLPSFAIGDRVKLSELGRERHPKMSRQPGTIVAGSASSSSLYVLFDDRHSPIQLHKSYLMRVYP